MIPEEQLVTWTHQGSIQRSSDTYASIRHALEASDSISRLDTEIYLQGSYKNSTNIRGDSDIDIVIQLNSTFTPDTDLLPPTEKARFEAAYRDATYQWADFRNDVLRALRTYYGSELVAQGDKSIRVAGRSGKLDSDVVVALQYRLYTSFKSIDNQASVEGITFFTTSDNRRVINYPKLHYLLGIEKNDSQHTDGVYKATVRIFKNARRYLADRGLISKSLAPSYFIECLLFNVDDELYSPPFREAFLQIVRYIVNADLSTFKCQNKVIDLFGPSPEQWDEAQAIHFLSALLSLWSDF